MQRRSPLYYRHLAAKATMTSDGWPQPAHYGDPKAEFAAIQQGCALIDLSATPKWDLKGSGVPNYIAGELATSSLAPAVRSAGYRVSGEGPDDYWCLTSDDRALLMSPLSVPTEVNSVHTALMLTDFTSVLAQLVLVGRRSQDVLSRLTSLNLRELGDGTCAQAAIARCHCTFVRLDVCENPAYRLLVTRDTAEFIWDALPDAGRNVGLTIAGVEAWARWCRSGS
jgi:glycine cleavage system aminomethyltransferase T